MYRLSKRECREEVRRGVRHNSILAMEIHFISTSTSVNAFERLGAQSLMIGVGEGEARVVEGVVCLVANYLLAFFTLMVRNMAGYAHVAAAAEGVLPI